MLLLLALGCKKDDDPVGTDLPDAILSDDRSEHWLDRPFPSDELLRDDGTVDWTLLPTAPTDLGDTVVGGWARQASVAVQGFGHMPAVYFRFSGDIEVVEGDVGITGPDGDVDVEWFWVDAANGDPWLADDLLIVIPKPTAPLASATRYVAWVSSDVADAPKGFEPPDGAPDGVAIATAFSTQDSLGQLTSLIDATDAALTPAMLQPTQWKRVIRLEYAQGQTPSGRDATVATVTYEDATTELTYLAPREYDDQSLDLLGDWPKEVLEGRISTLAFQDFDERPWASAGLGLLGDFDRIDEGWLHFDGDELLDTPEPETMRIVVQVPKSGKNWPVMTWDHGTGGHAYNAVARVNVEDRADAIADALDGVVVVSRDQPLYGTRYPLIDEGFSASLGFYNIGNLPAFRDNTRQAAVDHRVLHRFVTDVLPDMVDDVDTKRVAAFGHSLGSVTVNGGLVAQQGSGASSAFLSGAGGYMTFYVLETGLLDTGNDVVASIAPLIGVDPDELATADPADLVAAFVGLPEEAWPNMGRQHPTMQLFQVIMDGQDPVMFAPDQVVPETILLGEDDLQVPNKTTRWLADITPDADLIECAKTSEYDGHQCLYRETKGVKALADWADGL